jgi:hypothetical protein
LRATNRIVLSAMGSVVMLKAGNSVDSLVSSAAARSGAPALAAESLGDGVMTPCHSRREHAGFTDRETPACCGQDMPMRAARMRNCSGTWRRRSSSRVTVSRAIG